MDCSQIKSSLTNLLNLRNQFSEAYSRVDENKDRYDPENKQAIKESLKLMDQIRLAIKKFESLLHVSLEQAQEIMETDNYHGFLGPEAIKQAFGVELSPQKIPPINFTKEQLERARKLSQFLVLRIDEVKDRSRREYRLNIANLAEISNEHNIKLMDKNDWPATDAGPQEKDILPIKDQLPQLGWALVSRELIPETKMKNYLEQTNILIEYLKEEVFKDQKIPKQYQEAIAEYKAKKMEYPNLAQLTDSQDEVQWKLAAKILSNLKITKLLRRTPIEILYDLYVFKVHYGEYLLSASNSDWSSECPSGGFLASLGIFDSVGACADVSRPDNGNSFLGASVSCRS